MAKIESVSLQHTPETINVGDNISEVTIITQIEFHPLDVSLKMEYLLYLLVYDIHGKPDVPIIIGNWDETVFSGMRLDGVDDLLGKKIIPITATIISCNIETPIALKLGDLYSSQSYHKRKLEVFASLIPAVGRSSKWSEPFEINIVF
jgi:hypothetical protein